MAFELWQTTPRDSGGFLKTNSRPIKLSGFNGILARRVAQGDIEAGGKLALDATAIAALLPGPAIPSPVLIWSTRDDSGAAVTQQILRVILKCGLTSCDVILLSRALQPHAGAWFPSDRESAEAMQISGGIARGMHFWKWSAPKMAIGGAILSPASPLPA